MAVALDPSGPGCGGEPTIPPPAPSSISPPTTDPMAMSLTGERSSVLPLDAAMLWLLLRPGLLVGAKRVKMSHQHLTYSGKAKLLNEETKGQDSPCLLGV